MQGTIFQVGRFGAIGIFATAVHYLVALAATQIMSPYVANGIGYLTAFLVSYTGHQHFTFKVPAEARSHRRQFPRFIAASLIAFLFAQLVLAATGFFNLGEPVRLAFAVLSVPPITFLLSRYWVYK